jgi:hypothetical protein
MDIAIIVLFSVSAFFFIVAFFQKDHGKQLEKEVEELTITLLEENQKMKKRISILEEELLLDKGLSEPFSPKEQGVPPLENINAILRNQVLALHKRGISLEQISKQSSLAAETVKRIIEAGK